MFVETYRREWFPQGREMIQGNRGDRQRGRDRRAALPPAPGRLLVRPDRDAPGSCCTTSARARPPTAPPSCSISARAPTAPTTTGVCSSHRASRTASPSLTDMMITYLVDGYYNPADELGVAWDDPGDRRRLGRHRTRLSPTATSSNPARRASAGRVPANLGLCARERPQDARHRRSRLHRVELRTACPGYDRRHRHRVRRARRTPATSRRSATSTTTRAISS